MVFSSILFLLYFLPFFILFYFLTKEKYKKILILFASILFYSWGAPKFIFVILGTTLLDFYLVKWMYSIQKVWKKRILLTLSVSVNLGLLIYFKYSNFFIDNFNSFLSLLNVEHVGWTKLILPIGISFYTFETLTYVIDVYRRIHSPLKNFRDYLLYIILFPKLIAGPIVRFHEIADQVSDRSINDTIDNKLTGFFRFVIGLSKKVLIANVLGQQADQIFAMNPMELSSMTAWVGILAYTFQIYFDFSGYSDMAIGIARMIGFKFPENFNNPYTSQSITEFWQRWHITLGTWMKNYLYIPLGGNRVKSKYHLYLNLWLVFLASGLWHGASWNFVIWGAYHGAFLVLERSFLLRLYEKMGAIFRRIIIFFIVVIGWVFFRVEHFSDAKLFLKAMFNIRSIAFDLRLKKEFLLIFILAVIFSFFAASKMGEKIQGKFYSISYGTRGYILMACFSVVSLILCIASITSSGFNPFIYFRF
ncbi:MAG TPA: MBOAT family O-acyltransferase [Cytophagaceae bacterium]|jgi:alginate O-acetyltransferase complex protein AlgI|nr:MBOAT family O-acyltransferase [Cytophagaceae bacterium]